MRNNLQQKAAALELCNTQHWRGLSAFTFNLKQSFPDALGCRHSLTETEAKKAFGAYMRALNQRVYGNAYKRHKKRLRVIPILEKSIDGRWHYHVSIEPPAHMQNNEFDTLAEQLWEKSPHGYGHGSIEPNGNAGWTKYSLKARGKSGLEDYFDCIDIAAFYNPLN